MLHKKLVFSNSLLAAQILLYLKMLKRYNYAPLTYTNAYFSAENKLIRIQRKTQEMVWLVDSSMICCETIQKHSFYDFVYNKT